eukprot:522987-Prymnesium_polylepis.1
MLRTPVSRNESRYLTMFGWANDASSLISFFASSRSFGLSRDTSTCAGRQRPLALEVPERGARASQFACAGARHGG